MPSRAMFLSVHTFLYQKEDGMEEQLPQKIKLEELHIEVINPLCIVSNFKSYEQELVDFLIEMLWIIKIRKYQLLIYGSTSQKMNWLDT